MTTAAHFTLHLRRFDEEMQFLAGDTIVDNSVRQLGADHQTKWRRWVAGQKKKRIWTNLLFHFVHVCSSGRCPCRFAFVNSVRTSQWSRGNRGKMSEKGKARREKGNRPKSFPDLSLVVVCCSKWTRKIKRMLFNSKKSSSGHHGTPATKQQRAVRRRYSDHFRLFAFFRSSSAHASQVHTWDSAFRGGRGSYFPTLWDRAVIISSFLPPWLFSSIRRLGRDGDERETLSFPSFPLFCFGDPDAEITTSFSPALTLLTPLTSAVTKVYDDVAS